MKKKILNNAYKKFFKDEHITYEEFVIMLSTNDELYFNYNEREYQVEYVGGKSVYMCVTKLENGKTILERKERFNSLIDLLTHFKVDGKTIHEIWPSVRF